MSLEKTPHILNASSNLLGICFVLVTSLKLTHASETTIADELSLIAAISFAVACFLSYSSIRARKYGDLFERMADYIFIGGMLLLTFSVVIFATGIL